MYRNRTSKADKLKQVLSIVYSRVVFQDFRRPVGIIYPSIHLHYNSVIAEPSDFGTLLYEALGESTGVEELRRCVFYCVILAIVARPALTAFRTSCNSRGFLTSHFSLLTSLLSPPLRLSTNSRPPSSTPPPQTHTNYPIPILLTPTPGGCSLCIRMQRSIIRAFL